MTLFDHILSLNGLTPDSTREAILFDETGEIDRVMVSARDCFSSVGCPAYWSLFRLSDYVTANYPQATSCTYVKDGAEC